MLTEVASQAAAFWQTARVAAHQLVRSGCVFASSYPGSPVVGIAEELQRLDEQGLVQFRYATNEKIAFEMAAAVAIAGQPAACVMKHVGVNVALDSIMGVGYTGVRAPLLLVVGDDPSCESSSTEQDSREMARLIGIPCLEPASIEELPAAIDLAARLSGQVGCAVMLRLTNDLCYSGAHLAFESMSIAERAPEAPLSPPQHEWKYLLLPAVSRASARDRLERLEQARHFGAAPEFIHEEPPASASTTGVIVDNAVYPAFRKAAARLKLEPSVWRTLMPWPLNKERVLEFAARFKDLVVVEALEPIIEEQLVGFIQQRGLSTRVVGSRLFPRFNQLDDERLAAALAGLFGKPYQPPLSLLASNVPPRGPTFCAGCPHTAFFFGFTQVVNRLPRRPFVGSDIGCYTLGAKSGIDVGDVVLCMGAGIGVATGVALRGLPAIALIGDSTFLHSGLPSLFNAIEQGVDLVVCILDNDVSAMTGGQPAVRRRELSDSRLYAIALGMGVRDVAVVDPFERDRLQATLSRMMETPGVSVLISQSPCALTIPKQPRRPVVNLQRCTGCGDCVTRIHCPAITLSASGKSEVDFDLCVGCGFCAQVCPEGAIVPRPYLVESAR